MGTEAVVTPLYSVGTWDSGKQAFTPQRGCRPCINITQWQLRDALRQLRQCGYSAHRTRQTIILANGDEMIDHGNNDYMVLVERTDGIPVREILLRWKR